ncbi:MAG: phage tail protein [Lachnospiraceae bacterium]|nr:phage tail protein [Lachnospiraceae bacterium]
MLRHGINTSKDDTGAVAVQAAACGLPFFIGAAPVHIAKGYDAKPVLCNDFAEAKSALGYSTEWRGESGAPKWSLCQAMYAHFMLAGMSPAIFYNVFNPNAHKTEVSAADYPVEDHTVILPLEAIKNDALTVKSGDTALAEGTDFEAFYTDSGLTVELLPDGAAYNAASLTIAYDSADPSKITAQDIEFAVEAVEMCYSLIGIVPDLLVAPGWSSNPTVAAVMAAKAPSINGLFRAKALIDVDTAKVTGYGDILKYKNDNGLTSEDMMLFWPMVRSGDYIFDLSVVAAGLMAKVDSGNGDCPYESPSNKSLSITGALIASGEEVTITIAQADIVSVTDGVVTVLNNGGWTLWGNYLACFPKVSDVAKMFVCTNRVQDWICNTFIKTFWQYLDRPLTPALRDAIINSFNSWLNGLTAEGKLYGGEITYNGELNPVSSLMGGTIRLDTIAASPVPMQRVDMHVTYSVDMLQSALS